MIINGIQYPDVEGNWLYNDEQDYRQFTDCVMLGKDAPLWSECTNEEKEQWEREHAPIDPEPENE